MKKDLKDDPQWNKSRGRKDGSEGKPKEANRERNIGHKNAEEHTTKPKDGSNRRLR